MSQKLKENIILVIFLAIILGGAYYWYSNWQKKLSERIPEGGFAAESVAIDQDIGREFLQMIVRIKKINVNAEFFASSQFKMLKDLTPVIEIPQIVGRKNPFLPF